MAAAASYDKSVLFICLGNICRSPIAEAVFRHLITQKGLTDKWYVDSAALGPWHVGSRPDPRTLAALRVKNLETKHIARQIQESDFNNFDYILAMDEDNMDDLERLAPRGSKAKRQLLGTYDPLGERIVDDPYYTKGEKAFHKTLEHCWRACDAFLKDVLPS